MSAGQLKKIVLFWAKDSGLRNMNRRFTLTAMPAKGAMKQCAAMLK